MCCYCQRTDTILFKKHCPNRPNCPIAYSLKGLRRDSPIKANCPTGKKCPNSWSTNALWDSWDSLQKQLSHALPTFKALQFKALGHLGQLGQSKYSTENKRHDWHA